MKGLRKKNAQIEKALRGVGSTFTVSATETKRKVHSERIQVESQLERADQMNSNKFLTESWLPSCNSKVVSIPEYVSETGSSKQLTENQLSNDEIRIDLGANMNQRNDLHFIKELNKRPNALEALKGLKIEQNSGK